MITMKKTAIAAAIAMSMGAATAAQAFPIVDFSFDGTFTMRDPSGAVTGGNLIAGTMQMDMGTGAGTAAVHPTDGSFFGYTWTAHNITMQATGPGTVHANMLFDWGSTANITVGVDFAMAPSGPGIGMGAYSITTMDSNGDGIPGIPMDNGPFTGFNAAFDGIATVTAVDPGVSAVPVPAAAWLLGSGLLGLVGVGRRKLAA